MILRRRSLVAVLLLCGAASADPLATADSVRKGPNQRIFVTRVDLTDPRITLAVVAGGPDPDGAGPWETTLRAPSEVAKAGNFDVVINTVYFAHQPRDGDKRTYFAGAPAKGANPVMINGCFATAARSGPALMINAAGHAAIGQVPATVPSDARLIIGGSDQVLTAGQVTVPRDDVPAPRTSVGLTADGKTLVLLVVDGRRDDWSVGLSLKELGAEMLAQGCRDALNLDGGGSSAMVRKTAAGKFKVVNTPSDGSTLFLPLSVERPVAFVLGVRVAAK